MSNISVSESGNSSVDVVCPECGSLHLRRLPRQGFLQKRIYSSLGFYPWECPICRRIMLLRKRGKRVRRSSHSK